MVAAPSFAKMMCLLGISDQVEMLSVLATYLEVQEHVATIDAIDKRHYALKAPQV